MWRGDFAILVAGADAAVRGGACAVRLVIAVAVGLGVLDLLRGPALELIVAGGLGLALAALLDELLEAHHLLLGVEDGARAMRLQQLAGHDARPRLCMAGPVLAVELVLHEADAEDLNDGAAAVWLARVGEAEQRLMAGVAVVLAPLVAGFREGAKVLGTRIWGIDFMFLGSRVTFKACFNSVRLRTRTGFLTSKYMRWKDSTELRLNLGIEPFNTDEASLQFARILRPALLCTRGQSSPIWAKGSGGHEDEPMRLT